MLLLCSDGLSNIVSDCEMLESAKECPIRGALPSADEQGSAAGARDNVTVVAVIA